MSGQICRAGEELTMICFNGVNYCDCGAVTCAALSAPVIGNLSVNEGQALSHNASVSGGQAPLSYSASGLPAWASINSATGVISGTAPSVTADTSYTGITVSVTDSCTSGTQSATSAAFTVEVLDQAAPCIPAAAPSASFSDSVTEGTGFASTDHGSWIGTAPIALTASGIPAWATFNDLGGGQYNITGTAPTVTSNTTYTYSVTGTNACNTAGATLSGNTIIVTNSGGGGGGGGCFTAGTQVTMADGTFKAINEIAFGDEVMGIDGQPARVTRLHQIEYDAQLYGFNGGAPFFTLGHPFLSTQGWVAMDVDLARREAPGIEVAPMEAGQSLEAVDGRFTIESLNAADGRGTVVYNITVERHAYIADGFHVHNTINKN